MGKKGHSSCPNSDLCALLLELAEYEKNVSNNMYKHKAYRKAAATLAEHPTRIKDGKEAKSLAGIGDKIAKKIDEILQTGKLGKLEKIRSDDTSSAIGALTRVSGIGPAAAKKMIERGIKSIDDLRKHQDELTHHQRVCLRHLEDLEKRIPREEITEIESKIKNACRELDKDYEATVCGSYRRGLPDSGDIDVLLCHKKFTSKDKKCPERLRKVVDHLKGMALITDTLSLGDTKFMGICRLDNSCPFRRLDMRLIPQDQYVCGVLYFTGSDVFNTEMRAHAQKHGFMLNEYSLRPIGCTGVPGEPVPIEDEKQVFEYLDLPYKAPSQRH
ncbi:DNA polymerase beta-like [Ornithodoros turicata]|uniref:DNA polymerase n=1 Tax=Ornithodoros turicata TaxID=34597 RepID=A0A2R5LMZ9_9ACAR